MRAAADRLVDPATLRYAAAVYGQHAAVRMDAGEGHAYAGYINIALGMLRLLDPQTPHAKLHDRLTAEVERRVQQHGRAGDLAPAGEQSVEARIPLLAHGLETMNGKDAARFLVYVDAMVNVPEARIGAVHATLRGL